MSATGEIMTLSAGRRVALYQLGSKAGDRVVVFCHPAPGSGGFDPDPELTAAHRVTLLGVDRPGYGRSDPAEGWADVASAADDLADVLDQRGVRPVGVVGWSAGGRVALALAARRPDLVDRLAVVATPAPDEEVPWLDPGQRGMMEPLRGRPVEEVRAQLVGGMTAMIPADPGSPAAFPLIGAGPADDAALALPGAAGRVEAMLAHSFDQGARGLADEIAGYCLRPWGFTPDQVRADTLLVYGEDDPQAGPPHGRWWQESLPRARLETVPAAGHLVVLPAWSRVLDHLVGPPEERGVPAAEKEFVHRTR